MVYICFQIPNHENWSLAVYYYYYFYYFTLEIQYLQATQHRGDLGRKYKSLECFMANWFLGELQKVAIPRCWGAAVNSVGGNLNFSYLLVIHTTSLIRKKRFLLNLIFSREMPSKICHVLTNVGIFFLIFHFEKLWILPNECPGLLTKNSRTLIS